MPLWESGVVRASANTAGLEPNPELGVVEPEARRPGMIGLAPGQGRYGRTEVGKTGRKKGKEATGKVGENTTALLRQENAYRAHN